MKHTARRRQGEVPNVFIVGAAKAGTSSLFTYLGSHPQVFTPSKIKEPHFFSVIDVPDSDPRAIRDIDKYLALFKGAGKCSVICDASPSYLRDPEAAKRIYEFNRKAKIIIALRNPIYRAFSHYRMSLRLGRTNSTFHEAVLDSLTGDLDYEENKVVNLLAGSYLNQVKRYIDTFGPDRVMVVIFEELVRNTENKMDDVFCFLDLDVRSINIDYSQKRNQSVLPKNRLAEYVGSNDTIKSVARVLFSFELRDKLSKTFLYKKGEAPSLNDETKRLLARHYREDVKGLESLLSINLPWKEFVSNRT